MNKQTSEDTGENTLHQYTHIQADVEKPCFPLAQNYSWEMRELKRLLTELKAANEQIEALKNTNRRSQQKLVKIAKRFMQARHCAYHDELTGLPNRSLLLDRLKQVMVQSARQNKQVALLFIDLDNFKNVNDRFGHVAGDQLLKLVATRLSTCIRFGDTVCRYGGDEFVIMLTGVDAQQSAAAITEKIRARLSSSYLLEGHCIEITASIGIAVYQEEGQNCNDLIKQADISMYLAKVAHKPAQGLNLTGFTDLAFS